MKDDVYLGRNKINGLPTYMRPDGSCYGIREDGHRVNLMEIPKEYLAIFEGGVTLNEEQMETLKKRFNIK